MRILNQPIDNLDSYHFVTLRQSALPYDSMPAADFLD